MGEGPPIPEEVVVRIKQEAEEQLTTWEKKYKLDRDLLAMISVVVFARFRKATADGFVLVVKGTASAYNSPVDALLGDSEFYEPIIHALNTEDD